jgi:hypothetical protein
MMDTLHSVLRTIRKETKSRRDHLSVFREFLGHLDRIGRRAARPRDAKSRGDRPSVRRRK